LGYLLERLSDDALGLFDFLDAHQVAVEVVAVLSERDVEVELIIDPVGPRFSDVIIDAASSKAGAGEPKVHRVDGGDHPGPLHPIDEDPISGQQRVHFAGEEGDLVQRLEDLFGPALWEIPVQSTHPPEGGGEPSAGELGGAVDDQLPGLDAV